MHESDLSFVPLLIVIALSFLVPLALSPVRRLGIPVIVGEIVAGIVVGKSGLGLVSEGPVLEVLSVFGFAYLMFLSGLEIDFTQIPSRRGLRAGSRLQRTVRNPFAVGIAMFLLTGVGSVLAGFWLRHVGLVDNPWLMALILSTTSLGVVAPVLKERGLIGLRYGQTILVCALIADFVTILLISSYVILRSKGVTLELFLVLVLVLIFLGAYRIAARVRENVPAQRLMRLLSSATSQIRVRGSLALALVFIALAEGLGIENILGAFLAGVIVSLLAGSQSSFLREKLDAIGYGLFIPIFFITVGVNFDLPALLASGSALELVLLLTAVAFGVKLLGGLVFRLAYGWRETFAASTLLSSRLSLIIAVATIGMEIGAISPAMDAAIILVAIITCMISPVLFSKLLPASYEARERVLVAGDDADAESLTRRLRHQNLEATQVTGLPDHETEGAGGERPAAPPQAMVRDLREAGIEQATALVAMQADDERNLHVCRIARELHAVRNVVAWVRDPDRNRRFLDLGVRVINPANSKLLILEGMVLSAEAFAPEPEAEADQDVRAVKLHNRLLANQPLRNLALPEGVSVLRIQRRDTVLVPGRDTVVRANDILTLAGDAEPVDAAARRLTRRW